MSTILDILDLIINTYKINNNSYPTEIIVSSKTKERIFSIYKEELRLDICDNISLENGNTYRGIQIRIDETEPLIRLL